MGDDVYRLVVNVLSDIDDPKVRFGTLEHELIGPPWSEGWHTDAPFDYDHLGLHKDDGTVTPLEMSALVGRTRHLVSRSGRARERVFDPQRRSEHPPRSQKQAGQRRRYRHRCRYRAFEVPRLLVFEPTVLDFGFVPITFSSGEGDEHGWIVLVHGGAGDVPIALRDDHRAGCVRAATAGRDALLRTEDPIEAVIAAVSAMEDDPRYNAGTGGCLTELGTLELDASVMEGGDLRAGGVTVLPPFANPVQIARAVMKDGRHALYAGEGAAQFAEAHGFTRSSAEAMITAGARERLADILDKRKAPLWAGGTVGAVCVWRGHVAAATSTGGRVGKAPGRVGDSPIIGAGTYADDASGACSTTGDGERFLRACVAFDVTSRLAQGETPEHAATNALLRMSTRAGGEGGLICVDARGRFGLARTTQTMSWAALAESWPAPRSGS